ncbi:MAG TPA: fused MFS/spermidine synthase [Thermoanaerobaculia bacterium]
MTRDAAKVASLLFFSGLSALIYQTVWLRQFRLIFGASTFATGAVLAIFMAGLGLGSALLGKRADAKEKPLAYYARLELLIAAAAAVSPLLLALAAKIYFASGGSPQLGLFGATVLRLALSIVVLGPATLLMGGTLPAAARSVQTNDDAGRRAVALLYGVNTLGAVAGTLLSTFILLERFGNRTTLFLAVGLNLLVAIVARLLSRSVDKSSSLPVVEERERGTLDDSITRRPGTSFFYVASATAGFAFLLMELVWYRMLSPILGGTTYMFGLVLAVALAGIGLGGALYALLGRGAATVGGFAITCTLEALAIAIPFALGDHIALLANALRGLGPLGFGGHVTAWVIVTSIVVFPAAVISGVQFPLLIALLGRGRDDVGRQIGSVYAWNTAGAIAGSLAGGFGLMPLLTAPGTWRLVVIVLVALGIAATLRDRRWLAVATAAAAVACITAIGPTAVWRHSGIGAARAPSPTSRNALRRWINDSRRSVLWERDGRESSVAVVALSDISFIINGKSDGAARGDAGTQVMQGIIAAALHPKPESALVVGLGTGSSAGWLAAVPSMARVDAVELEPVVLDVARACEAVNAGVMTSPKVHVTIGDAREVLLTSGRTYDIIASEPSNPYRAGIASLFTQEFYLAARDRLRDRGIFAQWVQSYAVHPETIRTIYATLTSVFPNVQTWWTTEGDLLLVASRTPIVVDAELLRARLGTEPFRSAMMNTWRVSSVEGFLAHLFANESFALAAAKNAEAMNTDDRTVIEFGFARSIDTGASLHRQIADDAAAMRAMHPRDVRGTVDWAQVEKKRPWLDDPSEPANLGVLATMALAAATSGDARAEEAAKVIAREQPIEGGYIVAQLRAKQGRHDEATELLRRVFVNYRKSAWPDQELMERSFELAVELARTDPKRARILFDALSKPFAAMQHENSRRFARIVIAPLFEQCGPNAIEALQMVEPYPLWQRQILTIRANCYALAGLDLAPQAWEDLERFDAAEQGSVATR